MPTAARPEPVTLEEFRLRPDGRAVVWVQHAGPFGAGWHVARGSRSLCGLALDAQRDTVRPLSQGLAPDEVDQCTACRRAYGEAALPW